ncbi:MAG: ABC transporter permease [bacterium]|nr:ABC transporter permease [bacterium]
MNPEKFQSPNFIPDDGQGHHLRMADLTKLSIRVFREKPLRTSLTILGISLGVGAVLFLVSLGYGLQYILIGKLAATEDSLITLEAYYPSESAIVINNEKISAIQKIEGSEEVSPVAEFPGEVRFNDLTGFVLFRIIQPNFFRLSGEVADLGSTFKEGDKAVVVSDTVLRLLNLKDDESSLGKSISSSVYYQTENKPDVEISEANAPLIIKGIIQDGSQEPVVYISMENIKIHPPFYQKVLVKAEDIDGVESLRDKLIEQGFLISAKVDLVNQAKKIMGIITATLGIFGTTALLVSSIGMFNTMVIGFLERIFEIGIMKSIGATARDIRNLFLVESLLMGLAGGIGGVIVGVGAGQLVNAGLNFMASYLGGKPISIFIYPSKLIIAIIVLSGVVGILSGLWPARKAAKLSPRIAFLRK